MRGVVLHINISWCLRTITSPRVKSSHVCCLFLKTVQVKWLVASWQHGTHSLSKSTGQLQSHGQFNWKHMTKWRDSPPTTLKTRLMEWNKLAVQYVKWRHSVTKGNWCDLCYACPIMYCASVTDSDAYAARSTEATGSYLCHGKARNVYCDYLTSACNSDKRWGFWKRLPTWSVHFSHKNVILKFEGRGI
jgi:hypothetical protein